MFFGRQSELAFLENLYNSNELHCVCLSGAVGIGKTTLLQELGRRKSKAYFCVRSCTTKLLHLDVILCRHCVISDRA